MDSLKLLILLVFFSSCAKTSYLFEQGLGQMSLLSKAKWNDKVLADEKVKESDKEKIRKIQLYKTWFYKFWERDETRIYSKTTFLEGEAVTWLVIASPFNEVKALKECFPIMGCFPYLGFFKKESALDYIEEHKKKSNYVFMRPVYAYSTLGYFTDTILSSFFYYEDFDLSELIFHELFHTIFFVEDEVELNENLANYFGKELALEYFKLNKLEVDKYHKKLNRQVELNKRVADLVKSYNEHLKNSQINSKNQADLELSNFLEKKFRPEVKKRCEKLKIEEKFCYPLKRQWNNASFAAYLTYENKLEKIETLRERKNLDLRAFFNYIQSKYEEYEKSSQKEDFSSFLFSELDITK
jgi:predicted aminopeptidase